MRTHARNGIFLFPIFSFLFSLSLAAPSFVQAQTKPKSTKGLSELLDPIVEKAIAADELPGGVLLVGQGQEILHRKAYGSRAVLPAREAMTTDTVFDVASLTKVVATTSSVMLLVEQGKVRLNDPVARYVPEFAPNGKDQVTVRHLLTHTSGLRPIPALKDPWSGAEAVLKSLYEDTLISPPGARFVYSDGGFIILAEMVRRVSGMPLDEFALENIFKPLGMNTTRFRPPADWKLRIAPTEEIDLPEGAKAGSGKGRVLRGEVHDPRARGMGGVAGHAGLFSTVDDLALFCRMLLAQGVAPNGKRIFAAATIQKMTTPQTPPWSPTLRGLGWDIDSVYSAPRGELFPVGSFGHTGFTGTAMWVDPQSRTFYILLANSVHPHGRPALSSLRSRIATAIASHVVPAFRPASSASSVERSAGASHDPARNAQTKSGIDVLVEENFAALRGKRVGLITNHTGVDRNGRSTIDLLAKAEGVKLVALFSPEHGIAGRADEKVASTTDPATGLTIHSLYGDTRRPAEEMLRGVDALVFDIQDAGVRFYTYPTTMAYAMEEAAKRKIAFYVLDRPNPLGGEAIEGPMLDKDKLSFVGYFPMPVRHGMTVGELARMFNEENKIGAELHVVAMKDWRRRDAFEATGLPWTAPSPNLRSLDAALLYPGIEILQSAGVSVGRGTETPFELFGAPWIKSVDLAAHLNRRFVPGVRFVPTRFTPNAGVHKGQPCEGITLVITDRATLNSMLMGLEIAAALWKHNPQDFKVDKLLTLLGNAAALERLKKGDAPTRILDEAADEIEAFRKLRAKYLLYQ
ncbi:MAG: DUF1343 domain-containing protein [Acidobacteria bacterium]|nr:DUF1343 domain-containing protein [Acidobacteriota bacterium]MBI3664560.1 DUF1343 domain-containing protein [Acidobacteriota bacterium]